MALIAGIDVGGTFTDVLLYEEDKRSLRLAKVFSTPGMQSKGLISGLRQFGIPLGQLDALLHGTTVATNAVIERKGAKAALVTTRGFKDVLELRRRDRPTTYGLTGHYEPLIPRSLSFEVDERVDAKGREIAALDHASVKTVAQQLLQAEVESVAVCLMNSYVNPAHEKELVQLLEAELPGVSLSASYLVAPEAGEFERATTTAINAYVHTTMTSYLNDVQATLEDEGFNREFLVMQSNGGVIPARQAGAKAARTVLSGPAAGTVAAAEFGRSADLPNVISCDMGGTSFDVALIPDGEPSITRESSIEYGIPLKLPMIDIKTVGAGGGSIAYIDRAGILQVGPESAGSDPGPACYGRGGTQPTVSDANMVLGRIAADQSLGTQEGFTLDEPAARKAIEEHVARPLGLDVESAALAIVRVANETMANAIRMVSVDKGHDPRKFALVGFGGAGPLHIAELARTVGATAAIIPPHPGTLSAFGCLMGDVKYDYVTSVASEVGEYGQDDVCQTLADQREIGERALSEEGFDANDVIVEHVAEMSYAKQLYSLNVSLGDTESGWDPESLSDEFRKEYAATFGSRERAGAIRLVSLHTIVTGRRQEISVEGPTEVAKETSLGHRKIRFDDGTYDVPILWRDSLAPGEIVDGPVVLNQTDTTSLLPPRTSATVNEAGSLVVEVQA